MLDVSGERLTFMPTLRHTLTSRHAGQVVLAGQKPVSVPEDRAANRVDWLHPLWVHSIDIRSTFCTSRKSVDLLQLKGFFYVYR